MSALKVVQEFFPKVTSIVDATHSTAIEVTKADASSRAFKKHEACAMAVACKRKFHLDGVIISRSVAYLVKGKQARRFKVPESVSREVVSFDRGSGFSPGLYELSAIPESGRLGVRPKRTHGHDTSTKPKRKRHITTDVRAVLGGMKPEGE